MPKTLCAAVVVAIFTVVWLLGGWIIIKEMSVALMFEGEVLKKWRVVANFTLGHLLHMRCARAFRLMAPLSQAAYMSSRQERYIHTYPSSFEE